jgi:hypothetical protein
VGETTRDVELCEYCYPVSYLVDILKIGEYTNWDFHFRLCHIINAATYFVNWRKNRQERQHAAEGVIRA